MTDFSAFSLAGKRVVVTGANTGIGQGISVAIAKAGGEVIGVGRSAMDETAALVKAEGAAFTPVGLRPWRSPCGGRRCSTVSGRLRAQSTVW